MAERKYERYKYKALLPEVVEHDEKYQSYATAMDQAFQNSEIHNIAITGIYGAGKSSFWKTYTKEADQSNFTRKMCIGNMVTISVAAFEQNDTNKSTNRDKSQAAIEKQIINQLLFQLAPKKIARSKYVVKKPETGMDKAIHALMFCLLAIGALLFYLKDELFTLFPMIFNRPELVLLFRLITVLFVSLPLINILIGVIKQTPLKIRKINIKGAEAEIGEPENDDVLNNNMQELVYLIVAGDVQTIVFEDLDRFEDVKLFVKLRELNFLVNAQTNALKKSSVRFVYLLRDDLFESKDRTKFFDFILPIVPAIDSHNSKGKMLELFHDISDKALRPSEDILEALSLYIDDMRLMLSIRNEYQIYSEVIDLKMRKLLPDKLLAIVVLKNIFPQEFSHLQQDRGYIYGLFAKINDERILRLKQLSQSIEEKKHLIEEKEMSITKNTAELICIYLPKAFLIEPRFLTSGTLISEIIYDWMKSPTAQAYVQMYSVSSNYTFDSFIDFLANRNNKFKDKWQKIDMSPIYDQIEKINLEINSLEDQKTNILNLHLGDLLKHKKSEELDDFFAGPNSTLTETEIKAITNNHYYNLIRFLLLESLIDETYPEYKGIFYENSLGAQDTIYLRSRLDRTHLDASFHLDHPELIVKRLKLNDYLRPEVFNYELIDVLRQQKKAEELSRIINTALSGNNESSMITYISALDANNLENLVVCLLPNWFSTIWAIMEAEHQDKLLNYRICLIVFSHSELMPEEVFGLDEYVAANSSLLATDGLAITDAFLDGLEKNGIQFIDVDGLEIPQAISVKLIQKALIKKTYSNLSYITSIVHQSSKDYIRRSVLNDLLVNSMYQKYRGEFLKSPDLVMQDYLSDLKKHNTKAELSEEAMIQILNGNLNSEFKNELIDNAKASITQLQSINDASLWDLLIKENQVLSTPENIEKYWEKFNFTQALEHMLNKFYVGQEHMDLPADLANKLLNCPTIVENGFWDAMSQATSSIDILSDKMSAERVLSLLQANKIKLNPGNLKTILELEENTLLPEYAYQNREGFVLFLQNNNLFTILTRHQIELIIDSQALSDMDLSVLLQQTGLKVSLFNTSHASSSTRKRILNSAFLEEDVPHIIDSAASFDLWQEYLSRLENDAFYRMTEAVEWSPEYIDALLSAENLSDMRKVDVLNHSILKAYEPQKIKSRIENISNIKDLAFVFDNKKPKIRNADQLKIAEALQQIEIASISNKEDAQYLNFKPSAYRELIKKDSHHDSLRHLKRNKRIRTREIRMLRLRIRKSSNMPISKLRLKRLKNKWKPLA